MDEMSENNICLKPKLLFVEDDEIATDLIKWIFKDKPYMAIATFATDGDKEYFLSEG